MCGSLGHRFSKQQTNKVADFVKTRINDEVVYHVFQKRRPRLLFQKQEAELPFWHPGVFNSVGMHGRMCVNG